MKYFSCLLVFFVANASLTSLFTGVISNWTKESRIPPCTIDQAFQYFLDITTPPSPVLLQQFAALATNDKEKKKLEVLSKVIPLTISLGYNKYWNTDLKTLRCFDLQCYRIETGSGTVHELMRWCTSFMWDYVLMHPTSGCVRKPQWFMIHCVKPLSHTWI